MLIQVYNLSFNLMRVAYQMIIMRKEDKICGRPKTTDVMTGQNSEKLPAGSRYAMT